MKRKPKPRPIAPWNLTPPTRTPNIEEGYWPIIEPVLSVIRRIMPKKPKPDRILVDREGIAYPPVRPVQLKGKPKP